MRRHIGAQTKQAIALLAAPAISGSEAAACAALDAALADEPDALMIDIVDEAAEPRVGVLLERMARREFVVRHRIVRRRIRPDRGVGFGEGRPARCAGHDRRFCRAHPRRIRELLAGDGGADQDRCRRRFRRRPARSRCAHRGGSARSARHVRRRGCRRAAGAGRKRGDLQFNWARRSARGRAGRSIQGGGRIRRGGSHRGRPRAGQRDRQTSGRRSSARAARTVRHRRRRHVDGRGQDSRGIDALEMAAPLAPGAPLCRALAPGRKLHGRELILKGGQIGGPDFFLQARAGRV